MWIFFSVTYKYIKNHSSTCTDNNDDGNGDNTNSCTYIECDIQQRKPFLLQQIPKFQSMSLFVGIPFMHIQFWKMPTEHFFYFYHVSGYWLFIAQNSKCNWPFTWLFTLHSTIYFIFSWVELFFSQWKFFSPKTKIEILDGFHRIDDLRRQSSRFKCC